MDELHGDECYASKGSDLCSTTRMESMDVHMRTIIHGSLVSNVCFG